MKTVAIVTLIAVVLPAVVAILPFLNTRSPRPRSRFAAEYKRAAQDSFSNPGFVERACCDKTA
jgi:hypothetical protein